MVDAELEVDSAQHEAVLHRVARVQDQHQLQRAPQQPVARVAEVAVAARRPDGDEVAEHPLRHGEGPRHLVAVLRHHEVRHQLPRLLL